MIKTIGRFINSKSQKISSAAIILAIFGLMSRFLGLWRDRLLAGQFGAGEVLDVYYAAFRIPDLIYNLLIVGAISSAFLPVFYEYLTKDKEEAWKFSANVLNILIVVLVVLSAILVLFAPQLVFLVAPGFSESQKILMANISRVLFLSPILLGLSALASALLQAFSRFFITSLAPVFYNLGIIFGIVFLVPHLGIWGLAYGVILGAFFHFIIQIPSLWNIGFRFKAIFDFREPGFIKMAKLWLPRTLSLFVLQANSIVTTAIASVLAVGSITIFNFADNLRWVPIGIVGIAFSTAAFPAMSLAYAQGKKDLFLKRFSMAVRQTLFIVIPLSFFFFVLRAQIVRIVLGTGQFNWEDTRLTSAALGLFAFGIFAAALIPLFTRAFFAFHNTKTPVLINVFSMILNIILSFIFVGILAKFSSASFIVSDFMKLSGISGIAILGLPLAVTISSIFNLIWFWFDLKKHVGDFGISEIKKSVVKILIASIISIIATYISLYVFSNFFDNRTFIGLFLQTSASGFVGGLVYLFVALILRSEEILMLKIPATIFNWRGVKNPEPNPIGDSLDDQY